ncbi:MAG: hypothetical protein WC662_00860 [Candidatus Paceibacterota bacterium]|jgi:hypothetical protein
MEKIKQFITGEQGKDILTILIVILVGLGSFGLGRLSKTNNSDDIKIEYQNQQANIISNSESTLSNSNIVQKLNSTKQGTNTGNYFASSRGKKYYPVGCSAGDSLKQENRIYFETSADAEKAGYTLSSSCQ